MDSAHGRWLLRIADDVQFRVWSYGEVRNRLDLYEPRIFGPEDDLRCNCGKYAGDEAVGKICDVCGVKVFADAAPARRQRMGHVMFACLCPHPLSRELSVGGFPIAPVAFRIADDRTPNPLGRKYETLIDANTLLMEALPERDSLDYFRALSKADTRPVQQALADIVGIPANAMNGAPPELVGDSLMSLLYGALLRADCHISAIIRSLGYSLRMSCEL